LFSCFFNNTHFILLNFFSDIACLSN
jgi:hypothetical protein